MNKHSLGIIVTLTYRGVIALLAACAFVGLSNSACASGFSAEHPVVLDMVHHNHGEARYESMYEDPAVIRQMGYNGKVYFLFDSPTLAVDWEWTGNAWIRNSSRRGSEGANGSTKPPHALMGR